MTLHELATRNGHLAKSCVSCDAQVYDGPHSVAAVLNRWNRYENRVGPIDMDEASYLAAIEAAKLGQKYEGADYGALMEGAS
jgi:hypothetical protein